MNTCKVGVVCLAAGLALPGQLGSQVSGSWEVGLTLAGTVVAIQDTSRPQVPTEPGFPAQPLTAIDPDGTEGYVRNVLRVAFDDSTSGTTVRAFLASFHATIVGGIPRTGQYYLEIPDPGDDVDALYDVIEAMRAQVGVASVTTVVISVIMDSSAIGDSSHGHRR